MVNKSLEKWRMCVDFTNLNLVCLKDTYILPNIDRLIDNSLEHKWLSFMEAYSDYNRIKMDPLDVTKTAFMTNNFNYNYKFIPFGLNNIGATYQILVDVVLSN